MEFGLINIINFFIVFFLIAPNIIFLKAIRFKDEKCESKLIILTEQISRFACIIFMLIPFFTNKFGYTSVNAFIMVLFGVPICLVLYYIFWFLYVKNMTLFKALMTAILPNIIFMLVGVSLMHIPLIVSTFIFAISHIYITYLNNR